MRLAAALEKQSEHRSPAPCRRRERSIEEAFGVQVSPGEGVTGYVDGRSVAVGGARLVRELSAKGAEGQVSERIVPAHLRLRDRRRRRRRRRGALGRDRASSKAAARALQEAGSR